MLRTPIVRLLVSAAHLLLIERPRMRRKVGCSVTKGLPRAEIGFGKGML